MTAATKVSVHRFEAVLQHDQPGLFGTDLPMADAQTVESVHADDAGARCGRRRVAPEDFQLTAGEPLQLPIDQLDDDPQHPRAAYPQACLHELAKDIAERGILQAIVVAPPDAQGRCRIRFGVQRWRAARLAGLASVPVVVRSQSCDSYDQVAENVKRHGLSPLELAQFIRNRVEAGESNAHIARKLAVDATTVAHHLTLLDLPPLLGSAWESGRCTSPRTLHELHKLHAEQPEEVAALVAGDLPLTRSAVAALRTSSSRSDDAAQGGRGAPRDRIAGLVSRSHLLCDRLDRLLAQLADAGPDGGEPLVALRQRVVALAQRLGG